MNTTTNKLPSLLVPRRLALNISILLVAAGAAVFSMKVQTLVGQWREYDKSQVMTQTIENCLSNLKDMETGQRGYLLTGKPEYLLPFETGSLALRSCLANLEDISKHNDESTKVITEKLTTLALNKEVEIRSTIALKKQGLHQDALIVVNTGHGRAYMMAIRELVAKINIKNEQKITELRSALSHELKATQYVFLGWLTTIAVLMSLVIRSMRRSQVLLRKAKEKLAFEATHDALTGLPNRRYLMQWLSTSIPQAQRAGTALGIVYIDLDGFSSINNTYGHAMGDTTLVWATELLREKLRTSDFVARLGGDEFVIVSTGQTQDQLEQLAQRLLKIFEQSSPNDQIAPGTVGLSMGLALIPEHGVTADDVLSAADKAMYCAKEAGKRCYRLAPFGKHVSPDSGSTG